MGIQELIQNTLDILEEERKLIQENSGYYVQYCPCGHVRLIEWDEFDLVEKAKRNPHLDALTLYSKFCPICKEEF